MSESPKILLVEDDETLRELISEVLKDEGYALRPAADVDQAIKILEEGPVDFILSDLRMPVKTGLDLFRWCLGRYQTPKGLPVPFAFISGYTDLLEAAEATRLGACGFIAKPFQIDDLGVLLRRELAPQEIMHDEESLNYAPVPLRGFCILGEERAPLFVETDQSWSETGLNIPRRIAVWSGSVRDSDVEAFESRGIFRFLLKTSDYAKYIGVSPQIVCRSRSKVVEKARELLNIVRDLHLVSEKCFGERGAQIEIHRSCVDIVEGALKVIFEISEARDRILNSKNSAPHLLRGALEAAMRAVEKSIQTGRRSATQLAATAVSALLDPVPPGLFLTPESGNSTKK